MLALFVLLVGATFHHNIISSEALYITVECVEHCTITNGTINGGEGDTITLKYIVNYTNIKQHNFQLKYDDREIVRTRKHSRDKIPKIIFKISPYASYIDLRSTALSYSNQVYSFLFKVTNLSTTMMGNRKKFTAVFIEAAEQSDLETSELKLNVQYGPNCFGSWTPSIDVAEQMGVDVKVQLSGNPQPKVTAYLEKKTLEVIRSGDANPYTYTVKLKHAKINLCGKNLTLKAVGYNNVTYTTKVNVIFTPNAPKITSAYFISEKCLVVRWTQVESGYCRVKYTMLYNNIDKTTNKRITTDELRYEYCFNDTDTSLNGTVEVLAQVGGKAGPPSKPVSVVVPVFTTPRSTTLTRKVTSAIPVVTRINSITLHLIIIVVVASLIFVVVILLVVLVCTHRISCCEKKVKDKKSLPNNSTVELNDTHTSQHTGYIPVNQAIDGEYEDISAIETPCRQPVQEIDYAELGPGGRIGEKPVIEPSLYAQVNTDGAYYPPLKPRDRSHDTQEPEYAVSTKARVPPSTYEPEYAVSANARVPPSTYEPEYAVSTKAKVPPNSYEPEYAVSAKARVPPNTYKPEHPIGAQEPIYDEAI